jgi:hypothetical protein
MSSDRLQCSGRLKETVCWWWCENAGTKVITQQVESTGANNTDLFVYFYTVHHFHYTYVPAGALTHCLVSVMLIICFLLFVCTLGE